MDDRTFAQHVKDAPDYELDEALDDLYDDGADTGDPTIWQRHAVVLDEMKARGLIVEQADFERERIARLGIRS